MKRTSIAGLIGTIAILTTSVTAQAATTANKDYVETVHGWVSVHSQPNLNSPVVGKLLLGQTAELVHKANAWWYEISVNGKDVYITTNAFYTQVVSEKVTSGATGGNPAPAPAPGPSPKPTPAPTPAPTPVPTAGWQAEADKVVQTAKTQLGAPYYWGHQVPIGSVAPGNPYGFDCSNFVAWSYKTALGIKFSGSSVFQRFNVGTPVPLNQIREGDLLFFATSSNATGSGHVGLYMGNGLIIQEGGGRGKVTIEPLSGTWFGRGLVFARRVVQ